MFEVLNVGLHLPLEITKKNKNNANISGNQAIMPTPEKLTTHDIGSAM